MAANEAELRALMRASLTGDANAYRVLLRQLSASLRAYYKGRLRRVGRSADEAEDLTQETLMAIHTRRHTYHPTEPLTPWVYAIALYKLVDHLRRMRASVGDVPIEDADGIIAKEDFATGENARPTAWRSAYGNGRCPRARPVREVSFGAFSFCAGSAKEHAVEADELLDPMTPSWEVVMAEGRIVDFRRLG